MESITIEILNEEPKINSKLKQACFYITRPIAEFLEGFNVKKLDAIAKRQRFIANLNKRDYIEEISNILYDTVKASGVQIINETFVRMLCVDEARDIFYERKQNGGFDNLNIMIN
jgi:hypothetical protein